MPVKAPLYPHFLIVGDWDGVDRCEQWLAMNGIRADCAVHEFV